MSSALDTLGLRYLPSWGNFLLVEVGNGRAVFNQLQRQGIIVRPVEIYGLPKWVRITIGKSEENDRLIRRISEGINQSKQ